MTFPRAVAATIRPGNGLLALVIAREPGLVPEGRADGLPSRPPAPNLLIIVADDQSGLCLGAAGDTRGATPNLDAFARQGVLFEKTFCNSPLCTPSRQSFITGLLPHAVGVTRLATPLPEKALTLGQWLSVLGYRTRRDRQDALQWPLSSRVRGSNRLGRLARSPEAAPARRRRDPSALETVRGPAGRLAERPVHMTQGCPPPPWSPPTSWTAPSST